jgi:tartrate-resistant acid phosphatase type 5
MDPPLKRGPEQARRPIPRHWRLGLLGTVLVAGWLATSARGEPRPASLNDPALAAKGRLHLLVVGDTGTGTAEQRHVADAMARTCAEEPCNAVLMLGDNFYPYGVSSVADPGWNDKFEAVYAAPLFDDLRFYVVLGNHDYGASSFGSKAAQLAYSKLPVARCGAGACDGARQSAKWTMPSAYYEANLGVVHLFALDTQLFVGTRQAEHMMRAIRASTAPWKVVMGHHPIASSGYHEDSGGMLGQLGMRDLLESVLCAGADLYLAGHDHNLEYIAPGAVAKCPELALAVSGAGSQVRAADAGGAPVSRTPQSEFFDDKTLGFVAMDATAQELELRFIDAESRVLFRTTLPARRPTRNPYSSSTPSAR